MSSHSVDDPQLREELESLAKQTQAELEAYLAKPDETAMLAAVADSLAPIQRGFSSLACEDAASLAEQMAGLAKDLANDRIADSATGRDALLQATVEIPQYLEWLRRGQQSLSFDLLPLINHIRLVRGLTPIEHRIRAANLPVQGDQQDLLALPELAGRLRPVFQEALLNLLRSSAEAESLEHIVQVLDQLKLAATDERSYRFWWLAESLVKEIESGAIPLDQTITVLLRDVDIRLKYLIDNGKLFSDLDSLRTLSQRFINQLASCDSGLERLKERTAYDPPRAELTAASRSMLRATGLPDVETLWHIADLLRTELATIRDVIENLATHKTAADELLNEQGNRLHEITNVLMLLNMDFSAMLLEKQCETLNNWSQTKKADFEDSDTATLASDLVLVEDSLNSVGEFAYSQQPVVSVSSDQAAAMLIRYQYQWTLKVIVREMIDRLAQSRVMTSASAGAENEAKAWSSAGTMLHDVAAVLRLLDYARACTLMGRLEQVVNTLAKEKVEEKSLVMDAFSELVATLEYYLRLLDGEASPDEGILDYAERQVALLEGLVGMPLSLGLDEENLLTQNDDAGETNPQQGAISVAEATPPTPPSASQPPSLNDNPAQAAPSSSPEEAPMEIDPEFLEVFIEEAQGELVSIREQLAIWRQDLTDQEAFLTIRRSFHTLKGSGRMVGLTTIGEFAWSLEQLLNRIRDGELAPSPAIVDTVDAAQAALQPLVDGEAEDDEARNKLNTIAERAGALMRGEAVVEPSAAVVEEEQPDEAVLEVEDTSATAIAEEEAPEPITAEASDVDPELVEIFVQEAAEILDASDVILERWRTDQNNNVLLNELRREMHTLKGSSRMTGFLTVGDLAHATESVLNVLSAGTPQDTNAMVGVLQRSLDRLNGMVTVIRQGQQPEVSNDLIDELKNLVGDAPVTGEPLVAQEEAMEEAEEQASVETQEAAAQDGELAVAATADGELTELDQELVAAFRHEAAELLDSGDVTLQRWSADLGNMELLNDLRREMHTLKGSSRMTGFMAIGDLAHAMESVLDAIGKGSLKPGTGIVELLQRALDGLHDMMSRVQSGTTLSPAEALVDELRGLLAGETPAAPARPVAPTSKTAVAAPEKLQVPATEDTIRVSATLLNNLVNEMGESSIYRSRIDQGVSGLRFNITELEQTVYRLRQQLRRLEIETEAQILFRYEGGKGTEEDFDPLELDRFSELQQLSRSLIEIVDDLANIQTSLDDQAQEMSFLLDQQGKVNKEVQQNLMRTRMVRFSSVAPRLRRVVRQVAQELGKNAELVFEGAEAEVDRTVLDNMVAPLEHMLRNSISHGIEEPQERKAKGKPEKGTIVLAMRREGAELVLNLGDDGAGLNFDAIRAKGEAQGFLKPGQAATEDELIALLLRPGFSTATKVSQISGRGVGMDVLNNAIKAMRGALLIHSERGRGTNFIIRLPFSLAVTQALLVKVGEDTYAVPLLSISSVARLDEAQYKAYLSGEPAEHRYGEHRFPVHNLGILFGVKNAAAVPFEKAVDKRPPLMLFRSAEASAALQVDAVLGNQEVIVKPVSPQLQSVTGISGATVLGDGRVVVVLELAALVRNLTSQSQKQAEARMLSIARQEEAVRRDRIEVLVIDDSITMRKVTARFLERHNMHVTTAKDGMDALAKLEEQVPDLAIMDIEMPRMDGFEVTAHIRNQPHLQHIPIIMVTSRGGEKHRARAAKLGVNDYLTKPYQEDQMMQSIRRILEQHKADSPISPMAVG